jgi:2'-5' RNA ligase
VRLFAAIRPPDHVLDHLSTALAAALPPHPDRSSPLQPRANWHVTLAFYGEVPDAAQTDVGSELAEAVDGLGQFEIELRGAGRFRRTVGWIGVGGDVAALDRLSRAAAAVWPGDPGRLGPGRAGDAGAGARGGWGDPGAGARGGWGDPGGRRGASDASGGRGRGNAGGRRRRGEAPRPHLTVTRAADRPATALALQALSVYAGPSWLVSEVVLMRSELGMGAGRHALHTHLATIPLAGR